MINILIVDDERVVVEILQKYFIRYFKNNDFEEFSVDAASNGLEAIAMMEFKKYDMVFLDVIMPKCDGIEVLDNIRVTKKDKHQPYICMVTAMGEDEDKLLFKQKGASSYAIKPYSRDTIFLMLDRYIKPLFESYKNGDRTEEEVFEDFDEFTDFYDLDDEFEDDFSNSKEQMEQYNDSHSQITALEFLKDYDDIDYILEDIEEIDESLREIIEYLDIDVVEKYQEDISIVLNKYAIFLNGLTEFDELSESLRLLNQSITGLDFSSIDDKKAKYIIEFIRAILSDLLDWKEHVFIIKDAVDIYYINASALNSCIQLEQLIKK